MLIARVIALPSSCVRFPAGTWPAAMRPDHPARRIHASTACCSSRWRGWCRHCLAPVCRPVRPCLTCLLHRLLHALALLLIGLGLRLGILHLWWCLLAIAATLAGLRRRLRVVVTRLGLPCWPADGG
jgi:hypothetical protein